MTAADPDSRDRRRARGPTARHADGSHRYAWEWDLRSPPDLLWPLLADTNRFDRDTGVPEVHRRPGDDPPDAATTGRRAASTRQYGVRLDYEQDPWEWEAPHWLRVRRRFRTGPLATLDVEIRLTPGGDGGTRLRYTVTAEPRHRLASPAITVQIGWIFARRFEAAARRFDDLASAGTPGAASGRATRLGRPARQRLAQRAAAAIGDGADPDAVRRLAGAVERDDDTVVARLRPYALADAWGLGRGEVLDACLRATRAGLLGFRWDLLCPECRSAKHHVDSLRDLPATVHCDTCNIDYGPSFARSVELTFRPTPAVRVVDETEHCIGNPAATPHVVAQALLADGAAAHLAPSVEPGRYRLRAPGLAGARYARVVEPADPAPPRGIATDDRPGDRPGTRITLGPHGWPDGEDELTTGEVVEVTNRSGRERLVLLERTAWGDQAATAADVTSRQEFRDLFADEALRPGEHVSVGDLTVVFTDLRDSTRLYQDVGDAVAFGRVLAHFDVLRACIAAEGGAVVKTIGDAVMAVFGHPAPALRAVRAAQAALGDGDGLHLKAGVHCGPCLAVTLNERLDYFGSSVNLAARLTPLSDGDDVVVSAAVHDDPEVAWLLDGPPRWDATPLTTTLKGFADEQAVYRLRAPAAD